MSEEKDLMTREDMGFLKDVGQVFVQSGFFKDTRDAAQGMVKIMAGRELGFSPVAAMTGIHIVEGKVELGANMMAALVRRSDRYDYRILEHSATVCRIKFLILAAGAWEDLGVSEFTIEDAKRAGLAHRPVWQKHPRNMLFARAMSDGVKWHCPDVKGGAPLYHEGEIVRDDGPMPPSEGSRVEVKDDGKYPGERPSERAMRLSEPEKPKARRTRKKREPEPEPEPEVTHPETKHQETIDVLSGKDPVPVPDEEPEPEPQEEPEKEDPEEPRVVDTSNLPPAAYDPTSGELLVSQLGLTYDQWLALSEETRKSEGHCTEKQLEYMKSLLSKKKGQIEQILAHIQDKWPDVRRSWQLSKVNLGSVLDWIQKL